MSWLTLVLALLAPALVVTPLAPWSGHGGGSHGGGDCEGELHTCDWWFWWVVWMSVV
jgi:hypothetical protein